MQCKKIPSLISKLKVITEKIFQLNCYDLIKTDQVMICCKILATSSLFSPLAKAVEALSNNYLSLFTELCSVL